MRTILFTVGIAIGFVFPPLLILVGWLMMTRWEAIGERKTYNIYVEHLEIEYDGRMVVIEQREEIICPLRTPPRNIGRTDRGHPQERRRPK